MLTNTPGVLDKSGKLLTDLTAREIDELFADGTISGGMLPKIAVGARRGEERRQHGAHHRRPRAARDAARGPDRAGVRHDDPLALNDATCAGAGLAVRPRQHAARRRRTRVVRRACTPAMTATTCVEHLGVTHERGRRAAPAATGCATARRCSAWCATTASAPRTSCDETHRLPGLEARLRGQRARPRRAGAAARPQVHPDQRAARLRDARARRRCGLAPLLRRRASRSRT